MISRDADYAVRMVFDLAVHGRGTRRAIAARQGIPPGCLPRVTRALHRAGIIATRPGRGGGVSLRREPRDVSLLDVVAAVDGLLPLNRCLLVPAACDRVSSCRVHPYWREVQDRLLTDLRSISFAAMVAGDPLPPRP